MLTGSDCDRIEGRSIRKGKRKALTGNVTTATVFHAVARPQCRDLATLDKRTHHESDNERTWRMSFSVSGLTEETGTITTAMVSPMALNTSRA